MIKVYWTINDMKLVQYLASGSKILYNPPQCMQNLDLTYYIQLITMGDAYNFDDYTVLEAKLLHQTVGLLIDDSGLDE